jgi:hypothetical protein
MVLQKKYKAALALSISVVGTLAVLPMVGQGFFWDLLEAAFLASTIGGLADWFAVTAIFRKPLGISYRTDILRRNRARIMQALVDYAANDLLSAANIMAVARRIDMAEMFVAYLEARGGRERIKEAAFTVLSRAAETMDTTHVAERVWPAIRESFKSFPLEKFLLRFFDMLAEEKSSARILHVMLRALRRTLYDSRMQEVFLENIREMREEYERQAPLRTTVIQAMGLDDERLCELAVNHLDAYINSMLKGEGDGYERLASAFRALLQSLGNNDSLKRAIAAWKETSFERIDLAEPFALWLERNVKGGEPFWREPFFLLVDGKIDEFVQKKSLQRRADAMFKNLLDAELKDHHAFITQMVKTRLEDFSDDELIAFVESRVDDDLQMIRINGSVVGAVAGMALFLIAYFVEKAVG